MKIDEVDLTAALGDSHDNPCSHRSVTDNSYYNIVCSEIVKKKKNLLNYCNNKNLFL